MRILLIGLLGCISVTKTPAKAPCEEVVSAYAIAVYRCTGDAARADADARTLRQTYSCQLDGYGEADTGYGAVAPLEIEGGGEISLAEAYTCAVMVDELPCETLVKHAPDGAWLEALDPVCNRIFARKD